MDIFKKNDIKKLLANPIFPSVSLFMPTHRKNPDKKQNSIRYKNLTNRVMDTLKLLKVDSAKETMELLRHLQQDKLFWSSQAEGFALFCSPDLFLYYRLPLKFNEQAVISRHFHIKPLLELIDINGIFYVMAVSQNSVRILRCSRQECSDITPEEMPKGIKETLQYDDPQSQLQYHSGSPGGSGKRSAMFHGQGVGIDEKKDNLKRYCNDINAAIRRLPDRNNTPLILIGVDPLLPIFRAMSDYPCLLEKEINLNPDKLKDEELHGAGWKLAETYYKDLQKKSVDQFIEYGGSGRISMNLQDVVPASHFGRVESLLVNSDVTQWGIYEPEMNVLDLHDRQEAGDQDLTDTAAFYTLSHGGTVHSVPGDMIPERASVYAALRY